MATTALPGARATGGRFEIARSRRIKNKMWWGICGVSLFFLAAPVIWILEGIIDHAAKVWQWSIFVHTSATQNGLLNAIAGTGLMMALVGVLTSIIGIGCGIYLAEFAHPNVFTTILRSSTEVLAGIPSIVFGYVGYVALVLYFHWGYSLLAAVLVLSFLVVPYVAKSTELALGQVPLAYREGGEALGMARLYLLWRVILKAAIPGMATGIIVALAISVGETAPLIYTANWSDHLPTLQLFHSSVGYLTYATYTFYDQPLQSLVNLASDASLLLLVLVIMLILLARLVVRKTQRFDPNRARDAPAAPRHSRRAAAENAIVEGQN